MQTYFEDSSRERKEHNRYVRTSEYESVSACECENTMVSSYLVEGHCLNSVQRRRTRSGFGMKLSRCLGLTQGCEALHIEGALSVWSTSSGAESHSRFRAFKKLTFRTKCIKTTIACLQDVEGEGWTTLETDCRYCELIDNGRVVKRNCLYKKRKKKKCKHHFLCKIDFCNQCFGDGLGNLAVSQPSCLLRVAWQLGTERLLQVDYYYYFTPCEVTDIRTNWVIVSSHRTLLKISTAVLCVFVSHTRESPGRGDFGGCRYDTTNRSAVAPFRCLTAMPPKGCTRAGILPGCPSLDRESREAEVGFEPRTFRSVNSHSNHLSHLVPIPLSILPFLDCLTLTNGEKLGAFTSNQTIEVLCPPTLHRYTSRLSHQCLVESKRCAKDNIGALEGWPSEEDAFIRLGATTWDRQPQNYTPELVSVDYTDHREMFSPVYPRQTENMLVQPATVSATGKWDSMGNTAEHWRHNQWVSGDAYKTKNKTDHRQPIPTAADSRGGGNY
ncbi:hypothetical protein T265_09666 [Opisthorchis viverrini]|uniref:Uncharacterized protein n=1 Tax=Opisthorchis viverrini TaxID=6198 RepID=A0A074ZG15_OPIVI|nr:hypothetical protein T265_09666 [Opisthorchis viverrini]KER22160.1 hypothetical protein T265_09666 [Opisthorchis viverrini]